MAITLAQSLGQNIGIFSDKRRILNGTTVTIIIFFFFQKRPTFLMQHVLLFQESASVMIVGQAVSWMMLGKCLPQRVSLLGFDCLKKKKSL